MHNDLHAAQAKILRELLFTPDASFAALLKATDLTSDHFTFHVKRLVELGLISKQKNRYTLTVNGKEYANRLDTDVVLLEKQAKVAVLLLGAKESGGTRYYLCQQRLKQPYFGFWGFATGKIRWGETVLETAARELKEETNLTADLRFLGIEHKTDVDTNGKLLEDKFFFIVAAENCQGELAEEMEGGKNFWLTQEELNKQEDVFEGVNTIIDLYNGKQPEFWEKTYTMKRY